LLREHHPDWINQEWKLHLLALRLARRRKQPSLRERHQKFARSFLRAIPNKDESVSVLHDYELGMLDFADRRFDEAAKVFIKSKPSRRQYLASGFAINKAQAAVAQFEFARVTRDRHGLVQAAQDLENCLSDVRRTAEYAKKRYKNGNGWPVGRIEIRNTWPVTARLHLARMYSLIGNKQKARCYLDEATTLRDTQVRASAWTHPNIIAKKLANCGWARYSRVLLCNAEGNTLFAEKYWCRCVRMLSEALHKIASEDYKNAEYLENILDRLLAVPRNAHTRLDVLVELPIKAMEKLKLKRRARYRSLLRRFNRKWSHCIALVSKERSRSGSRRINPILLKNPLVIF